MDERRGDDHFMTTYGSNEIEREPVVPLTTKNYLMRNLQDALRESQRLDEEDRGGPSPPVARMEVPISEEERRRMRQFASATLAASARIIAPRHRRLAEDVIALLNAIEEAER